MRKLALPPLIALALAAALPASAAAETFTFSAGSLRMEGNTQATITVFNPTTVKQSITLFLVLASHTIEAPPGGEVSYSFVPCFAGPCTFPLVFSAQTAQLFPSVQLVTEGAGSVYTDIPAGGFVIDGPRGRLDESVSSLAASDAVAFGSLQSAAAALGGAAGPPAVSSQLQSLQGEVQSLQGQITTLTSEVRELNQALRAGSYGSTPKPKKKKKRRQKR